MKVPIPYGLVWSTAKRLFMGRLDVRVRAHDALFVANGVEATFINVTNHSPSRTARPTHVMIHTTPPIALVNPARPTRTLAPNGDSWETWIEKRALPDPSQDIRTLVEVRLSTGETLRATPVTPGVEIPAAGEIPP